MIKLILEDSTPMFESMMRQMSEYPEIKQMLKAVLFQGRRISFNLDTYEINLAAMFGFIKNNNGAIQVANRIFEMRLCNFFLSEEELTEAIYDKGQGNRSQFFYKVNKDL